MLSNLAPHVSKLKYILNENSSTILTAFGVGGTIATAYLTGRATVKAVKLIEEEIHTIEEFAPETMVEKPRLSKTETVKLVWPKYILPVAVGSGTIASIVLANRISSRKIAALTVATAVSERAFQEYKEKVIEKLGARQDEKIRDDVAQDRITSNPPKSGEVIMVGSGQVLCYDMLTGRYFNSTVEDIRKAENKVNYELIHYMSCSLSNFYDEIGLPPTPYTDSVGWNLNNHMEVQFSATMTDDQRPCIAISFTRQPMPDFEKHWD